MCVVSMVIDHFDDKWRKGWPTPGSIQPYFPPVQPTIPSQAEIDEFRKLLERAREYDKKNNEPDCEMESKKKQIKELADKLGINIDFI